MLRLRTYFKLVPPPPPHFTKKTVYSLQALNHCRPLEYIERNNDVNSGHLFVLKIVKKKFNDPTVILNNHEPFQPYFTSTVTKNSPYKNPAEMKHRTELKEFLLSLPIQKQRRKIHHIL